METCICKSSFISFIEAESIIFVKRKSKKGEKKERAKE